jgi:hypothetical protein
LTRPTAACENAQQVFDAITVYFDGSGDSRPGTGTRFIVLAGVGAESKLWPEFAARWQHALERWGPARGVRGCRHLHMVEAAHLTKSFARTAGWTREKVRQLTNELLNECVAPYAAEGRLIGGTCAVDLDAFRTACAERPSLPGKYRDPESICVKAVLGIAESLLVPPEGGYIPDGATAELYFDRGERFLRAMDRVWRKRRHEPRFQHIKRVQTVASTAPGIQLADFMAYQVHQALNRDNAIAATKVKLGPLRGVHHRHFGKPEIEAVFDRALRDEARARSPGRRRYLPG